ncbi:MULTISPECIES: DNA repair protein RecO [Algibacter]|jgi:DNA repair protein RecO (recombination protein O)|uniref:DNA repair protein RecO n=1 Tax=Algibacter TaxID=261827 RepID=UPI00131BDF68|nr:MULTISPECIES: DNA repair protein RecO [Algibacter]MDO7137000.1 DNA repair protein RecO [Algibacter lectus]
MLVKTNAIVLSKLKYRDNDLIVKCYTEELGVVSFLLRGVLKSKKGGAKIAYFQLLSQLHITVNYKDSRSLQSLSEVRLNHLYSSLHTNVLKSAIVMFLSEVLSSALREEEQNETLFRYLETTLLWLDEQSDYANFHLLFLLNLTKYLGFYPDSLDRELDHFNLIEGKFQVRQDIRNTIAGEDLNLLKKLLETTFNDLQNVKINGRQRQSFLNMILLYFELHLGSFKTPKSLKIFNQVFS